MEPITRKEKFLAKAAGQSVKTPTPITREEMYLERIAQSGGAGGTGGADWNAAEGESGHIANRPFYSDGTELLEILPETKGIYNESDKAFVFLIPMVVTEGNTYLVTYNGAQYQCVAESVVYSGIPGTALGNVGAMVGGESTGEPFAMLVIPEYMVEQLGGATAMLVPLDGSAEVTLSIKQAVEKIHKLDNKYLDLDWIPKAPAETVLLPEITCEYDGAWTYPGTGTKEYQSFGFYGALPLVAGTTYIVFWDGSAYAATAKDFTDGIGLGNGWAYSDQKPDTGEPFCILTGDMDGMEFTNVMAIREESSDNMTETHTVRVIEREGTLNKMPEQFMPESVDGVVMRSPSGAKFKISVDDNGYPVSTPVT